MGRTTWMSGWLMIATACAQAAAGGTTARFASPPTAKQVGGRMVVAFAVSAATDVEVAILGADGKVVRHLAAGLLGGKTPPPLPLKPGRSQGVVWDGRDDWGRPIANASACTARVRVGMGVRLERVVGGDPYAYYSRQMGQGDHAAWRMTGLEAKPDGRVYVLGNANNYGPAALRRYDAAGRYLSTVYPPPAGKRAEQVKAWGTCAREDGTYSFRYNDLSSPALSTTFLCGNRGRIATLIPSPRTDQLLLTYDLARMVVNTDGTIPAKAVLDGRLVDERALGDVGKDLRKLTGQMHTCLSADGGHLYLSGVFAAALDQRGRRIGAQKTGFWRDGQVFRIDLGTGQARTFFAMDQDKVIGDLKARGASPIADARYGNYAALQGVAVDARGHVFVCDRQNKRVVVLGGGEVVREIPVAYPDAVAVNPKSQALYVTTRTGHYHKAGWLRLLKFRNWAKDAVPTANVPLCEVRHYSQPTYLAVAQSRGEVYIWVAYTALPVRIYRDRGVGLELVKDFYQAAHQRCLDLQHVRADQQQEDLYVSDGFRSCFRITDWTAPAFSRCMQDKQTPLRAISLAIDARHRRLYAHDDRTPVLRYRLGGQFLVPDPIGRSGTNACTPKLSNDWRIGLGRGDRGIAAAPDGSVATLGALGTGADYGGYLRFFQADPNKAPWDGILLDCFGQKVRAAGVCFDLHGNLYAGKYDGAPKNPPKSLEKNAHFLQSTGRIYKFAPTGSPAEGRLFPTAPAAVAKIYDVHYGPIGPSFARTPRFGVDGWGRIYYPTALLPRVSVIDNEGNAILSFGTYGNRDSLGGLEGDLVPTNGIPMAWPNSVDVTDDYVYVSDIVNIRVLRLKKTFQAEGSAMIRQP